MTETNKTTLQPFNIYGPKGLLKTIQVPCFYDELAEECMMTEEAFQIAIEEKKKLFADINNVDEPTV